MAAKLIIRQDEQDRLVVEKNRAWYTFIHLLLAAPLLVMGGSILSGNVLMGDEPGLRIILYVIGAGCLLVGLYLTWRGVSLLREGETYTLDRKADAISRNGRQLASQLKQVEFERRTFTRHPVCVAAKLWRRENSGCQ